MGRTDESIIEYWDKEWNRRDLGGTEVLCNTEKAKYLLNLLWRRVYFLPLTKLEVGCGMCFHIKILTNICKEWGENYLGIDVSPAAIEVARRWGVSAQVDDIYNFETDKKFELFLFLDVLEHMQKHKVLTEKVKQLAAKDFWIFGNIPLYNSEHFQEGGFERNMNIGHVTKFMNRCGIKKFVHKIYGIDGWPYMWFEGRNDRTNG